MDWQNKAPYDVQTRIWVLTHYWPSQLGSRNQNRFASEHAQYQVSVVFGPERFGHDLVHRSISSAVSGRTP